MKCASMRIMHYIIFLFLFTFGCNEAKHVISLRIANTGASEITNVRIEADNLEFSYGLIVSNSFAEYSNLRTTIPRSIIVSWIDAKGRESRKEIVIEIKDQVSKFDGIFIVEINGENELKVSSFTNKEFYKETNELIRKHLGVEIIH